MNKPAPGHYRKLLSNPNIRIAFTNQPIIGCTKIDPQPVIDELKASSDEYAKYYIDGLESGSMAAIVENKSNKVFAPGELYFKY